MKSGRIVLTRQTNILLIVKLVANTVVEVRAWGPDPRECRRAEEVGRRDASQPSCEPINHSAPTRDATPQCEVRGLLAVPLPLCAVLLSGQRSPALWSGEVGRIKAPSRERYKRTYVLLSD